MGKIFKLGIVTWSYYRLSSQIETDLAEEKPIKPNQNLSPQGETYQAK